jgi:hypothetical protein
VLCIRHPVSTPLTPLLLLLHVAADGSVLSDWHSEAMAACPWLAKKRWQTRRLAAPVMQARHMPSATGDEPDCFFVTVTIECDIADVISYENR